MRKRHPFILHKSLFAISSLSFCPHRIMNYSRKTFLLSLKLYARVLTNSTNTRALAYWRWLVQIEIERFRAPPRRSSLLCTRKSCANSWMKAWTFRAGLFCRCCLCPLTRPNMKVANERHGSKGSTNGIKNPYIIHRHLDVEKNGCGTHGLWHEKAGAAGKAHHRTGWERCKRTSNSFKIKWHKQIVKFIMLNSRSRRFVCPGGSWCQSSSEHRIVYMCLGVVRMCPCEAKNAKPDDLWVISSYLRMASSLMRKNEIKRISPQTQPPNKQHTHTHEDEYNFLFAPLSLSISLPLPLSLSSSLTLLVFLPGIASSPLPFGTAASPALLPARDVPQFVGCNFPRGRWHSLPRIRRSFREKKLDRGSQWLGYPRTRNMKRGHDNWNRLLNTYSSIYAADKWDRI